jgi:hypothetical protein
MPWPQLSLSGPRVCGTLSLREEYGQGYDRRLRMLELQHFQSLLSPLASARQCGWMILT